MTLLFRPYVGILYSSQANSEDLGPALKSIQAPILFLHADSRLGSAVSEEGQAYITLHAPDACNRLLKGAEHNIHKSMTSAFLREVRSFLKVPGN